MNFAELSYRSPVDGRIDRYYCCDRGAGSDLLVYLHGHGSGGDQLLTRPDIAARLPLIDSLDLSVISPDLRGNAWMNPAAAADLAWLLRRERAARGWRRTLLLAGSMGGTGALIFAMLHPGLVDRAAVLGAATSLGRYAEWCRNRNEPAVLAEIRAAILTAYPDPADLRRHDVSLHAGRLTMPVRLIHAAGDPIIPVDEARDLAARCCPKFKYTELASDSHDAPLDFFAEALKEMVQ
ncbi:MAG: alpha/beta fold hydrolase [Victivallaceae bacterium]